MKCTRKSGVLLGAAVGLLVGVNTFIGIIPGFLWMFLYYLSLGPIVSALFEIQSEADIATSISLTLLLSVIAFAFYGFVICKLFGNK